MSVNSCPIPFPLCETQVLALEEFNFFFLADEKPQIEIIIDSRRCVYKLFFAPDFSCYAYAAALGNAVSSSGLSY